MRKLPCLLIAVTSLGSFALALDEDDHAKRMRDLAETRGYTLGRPVSPKLTPDGQSVIYLRGGPRDRVLRLYDFPLPSGPERELLTPEQVLGGAEEKLSDEEKARRERARVTLKGFTRFDLSKDGAQLLVSLSGRLYVVNRASLKVTALPGEYWIDPRFSPDGTAVAAVADGELHVIDLATNTSRALTSGATETLSHGTAEFVAQEEMDRREGYWWSPDSQSIAYQQTDESAVEVRHIADPLHPEAEPTAFFYPRAGSTNATVRLGVISRGGGVTRWVQWDAAKFPYLTRVIWREAGDPLCLSVMDRTQQTLLLLRADPATGATTEILRETDAAWINLDESFFPRWLPGGKEFLWTTESRGAWQVELRAADGQLLQVLTPPDFIYKELLKLNASEREIYVGGGFDPRETHVWRFLLNGSQEGVPLTEAPGQHWATFSEDASTFIHQYSLLDGTVGTEVLRAAVRRIPSTPPIKPGDRIATIPSVAETPPSLPNLELTCTDGDPSFYAALIRPKTFQPGKKYPVILSVYAGPTSTVVSSAARAYLEEQWMADHGCIVVSLDGRGTPHRGRAWLRAVRGNLIDIALEDQVAGLRALGRKYPELDLSRVGVTGWSFGGYFSAMAAIRRPEVFRCGIAGAPVITWENYDTFYTERYLGLPQTDPAAYKVSSVLTYADQLTRPLLLVHGLTDDNVYAQHTLQLADTLFMAGKPYEFLPMLGTHAAGSADPDVQIQLQMRMMEFLKRELKP